MVWCGEEQCTVVPTSAMRALAPALVASVVQGAGTSSTMGVW